jgi:hypothetical protein
MAGKYTPLEQHLKALLIEKREVTMTFGQIERILNDTLPVSASKYRPWWSNEVEGFHVQSQAWLGVGWKVARVDLIKEWVQFIRT